MTLMLILCFALLLFFPAACLEGARNGLLLWFHTVLPTLFPFLFVSSMLVATGTAHMISRIGKPFLAPVFRVSTDCCYAILIGLVSGYPLGAKTCADLVQEGSISKQEGQYLLCFCNNASPMFIISFTAGSLLGLPYRSCLLFWLTVLVSAFFTGAIYRFCKHPFTKHPILKNKLNDAAKDTTEQQEQKYPLRTASHYIFTQGKRLEQLSHKLLELVSMEKQDFSVKPIKATAVGENLWTTMRPIWESRQIQGSIRMEQATLWGDIELLLSLLYNLLDNATKAVGEKGQISLEGRRVRDNMPASFLADFQDSLWESGQEGESQKKWYGIRICDNGRGIPQEEIDRITEPFYMVDKSRSRKEGGAGLGMSLCQRILQLHRGNWKMRSTLGEGTQILIRLPMDPPQ